MISPEKRSRQLQRYYDLKVDKKYYCQGCSAEVFHGHTRWCPDCKYETVTQ